MRKKNPWGGLLNSRQLPSGHPVFSASAARSSEGIIWMVARRLAGAPAVVPSCPGGAAECQLLSLQSQSLDLAAALRPLLFLCRRRDEGKRQGGRKMFTSYQSGLLTTEDRQRKSAVTREAVKQRYWLEAFCSFLLDSSSITWTLSWVKVLRINPGLQECCSTSWQSPAES